MILVAVTIAFGSLGNVTDAGIIDPNRSSLTKNVPQATVTKAVKFIQSGKLDDARALLTKQFATAKNQPHPDILIAQILLKLKRGRDARRVMESLAVKHSGRLDVRLVFCEMAVNETRWFDGLMHAKAAQLAKVPANWDESYTAAIQQDLLLLKGKCCEGCQDWQTAKQIYSAVAEEQDPSTGVLVSLARCEFQLKQYKAAATQFDRAFQQDRQLDVADVAMARLFNAAQQPKDAERHYRAAIEHADPAGRARAKLAFATWLLWNNKPSEIAGLLTTSFKDTNLDQQRQLTLAMAFRMLGQLKQAQGVLSPLHQQKPTDFAIGNQFALVMIELPDEALRSRALQIAEANVRNNERSTEAWSTLGWIQFKLGDVSSAQQNMARGMSSGVVSRDTAWQMAQLHKQLGHQADADKLFSASRSSTGPFFAKELKDSK